jgi:PAS domain S-box-containing protein
MQHLAAGLASFGPGQLYSEFDAVEFGGSTEPDRAWKRDRAIWHALPGHIAVVNRTGSITHVNEAWNRFAVENGASSPSTVSVGANYLEVCRRAAGNNCDDANAVLAGIVAVLAEDMPVFQFEYPCHAPNTERWFLLTCAPLGLGQGGAVCLHVDVTARVLAEQRVARTFDFFRALIENVSDIVTIVDSEGVVRYQSPSVERVLGYTQDELVGRPVFDLLATDDVQRIRHLLEMVKGPGATSTGFEFAIHHRDGKLRILEGVAANALRHPAVAGIVVTCRDVTDRRTAEAALREKEAALRNSHRSLQAVTARLFEAEELERRRLSRELHDDLNQKLASLAMDTGALARALAVSSATNIAKDLRALQSRLTGVCGQVRTMAYQLHPSILDDLGLVVAVRSYCAEFSRREGIRVRFTHRSIDELVSKELASAVYRITQEALRNVARHSGAKDASVSLRGTEDALILNVRDSGCGFNVEAARSQAGLGLTSMEERARMLGGTLEIQSKPGKGTTVVVRIPFVRRPE